MVLVFNFGLCHYSWDNGENERMSPWDLEKVDEEREYIFIAIISDSILSMEINFLYFHLVSCLVNMKFMNLH